MTNRDNSLQFRRAIQIRTRGCEHSGCARVSLEDDYHHFRVEVHYHRGVVTQAQGTALRTPYTLCASAGDQLQLLRGMPLSLSSTAVSQHTDQTQQCSHMFDEAGLAIAAAAGGIRRRDYAVTIPRHQAGRTQATLYRDGAMALAWQIDNGVIVAPAAFAAQPIGRGFSQWLTQWADAETVEAALVLRRCAMISLGRLRDLDIEKHARNSGHCFAQQPQRAAQALRIVGSTQDFSDRPAALCADDQHWLDELANA